MRSTRATLLALLLPAAITLTACTESTTEPPATRVVPIGGLFSLTGNWSTLGLTSEAALELAVEDINASLDFIGSWLRLRALVEDTELDPERALDAARRMREAGVRITLGPQSSAEVEALKSFA